MKKIRIGYIEDDEDDVLLLHAALEKVSAMSKDTRIELAWIAPGPPGWEQLDLNDYDLLVVDYSLNLNTGIDLIRHWKQDNPDLPMILLTGMTGVGTPEEVLIEAARLAGAQSVLLKDDLTPETLRKVLLIEAD